MKNYLIITLAVIFTFFLTQEVSAQLVPPKDLCSCDLCCIASGASPINIFILIFIPLGLIFLSIGVLKYVQRKKHESQNWLLFFLQIFILAVSLLFILFFSVFGIFWIPAHLFLWLAPLYLLMIPMGPIFLVCDLVNFFRFKAYRIQNYRNWLLCVPPIFIFLPFLIWLIV